MWTSRNEKLANAPGTRFAIDLDSRPASFSDEREKGKRKRGHSTYALKYNSALPSLNVPLPSLIEIKESGGSSAGPEVLLNATAARIKAEIDLYKAKKGI